jgi:EmrB/QacA subfamily drug resistance transporter
MIALSDIKSKVQSRWVLAAMTCCLSCIFLDSSLIPIALPTIQKEFGFSGLFMQWILNIFYISTAVFVIFAGKLADIYGRKKIFCLGISLYALGAIFAGLAKIDLFLLIFRGVQGIGAALMMPSAMAILMAEFPPQQLGKALGYSAGISSIFLSVGPFLGGVITEFFSWRMNFFLPLPLCILGFVLTVFFVPKGGKQKSKLDVKGLLLLIIGLGTLMFSLMQAKYWGLFSTRFLNYAIMSCVVLIVLYYHSKLIDFPLLDFSLFKINSFRIGLVLGFITQFIATYTVFIAIFFQKALYLSPIESGAYIVVSNLPTLFCAPAAGIIADNKGVRFPIISGFFLLFFSMAMLVAYTFFRKQSLLFFALATFGSSLSLITTPVGIVALKEVAIIKKGLAAGIYNTVRYLGSAFGIVCVGMIGYVFRIHSLQKLIEDEKLPDWIEASKVDEILKLVENLPDYMVQILKTINTKSFFISMNAVSLFITLFVSLGLLLTFLYLNDYKKA